MPRKKKEIIEGISDKLDYLGLDLDEIPEKLKKYEPLEYKVQKFYDEKQYRQYRYIDVKDIQILLSPSNRLEDINEKYKKARPLYEYLDKENEDNILKYTTFLNMLRNMDIEEIERVEKEQENLNKSIPFKVKFHGNYLWQIYYSENTDKYFMIVPTEDTDTSTFFYILKKQIEGAKGQKIFVPISNVKYSSKIFKSSEFEELENYLWLFTKDWPSIYEVYNKKDELSIQIIGETNVYEKVKTFYKLKLNTVEKAIDFYKLLKALFILQTELPNYYNFETKINEDGWLEFYFEDKKVEYKNIIDFIREQYKKAIKRKKELRIDIKTYKKKLKHLQELVQAQEIEYLAKEKQISTFLECKKSFFGKFKYYFKYSKKNNKKNVPEKIQIEDIEDVQVEEIPKTEAKKEKKKVPIKRIYTLEELITNYKELEDIENTVKKLLMDINALKLKTKNMAKKIENATKYIEEIDNHKKSIFEFWKYSNKDEMTVLPEGEQEEINVIKKIEKVFNYSEDLEEFGIKLDRIQRKNLSKSETDSAYIATTELINLLNEVKNNNITSEDLEKSLISLKSKARELRLLNDEEYDIFGNIIEDTTRVKRINNKRHRELPRDKFDILEINKNAKISGYKLSLQIIVQNLVKALENGIIPDSLPVYKATDNEELESQDFNIFNINPENEMKEAVKNNGDKINLYKLNVQEGTKGIGFTNIIFYDNKNKTLPIGMDLSTKLLVDISKMNLNLLNKKSFKVVDIENEEDDFSYVSIKDVNVFEYEMVDGEVDE